MSVFLCPVNCEDHDYDFPHSVIQSSRVIKALDGAKSLQVTEYIVCRECRHMIGQRAHTCHCRFRCHNEDNATITLPLQRMA